MEGPKDRNLEQDNGVDSKDDTYLDTESSPYAQPHGVQIDSKPATQKQIRTYTWAFSATSYGMGTAFGSAGTYMTYQLQQIAYASVGNNPGMPSGSGCLSLELPCRVPLGSSDVNLTSLFLYLNAIIFGISGALAFLVCGWGDYLPYKREQYVGFLCIYGALVLPTAALTAYNMSNYTALLALYVVFNIIGFVAGAWQNVFVPYLMQKAAPMASLMQPHTPSSSSTTTPIPLADALEDDHLKQVQQVREREGVKISVAGNNALNLGMTVFYAITIGISYASASASLYAGLYMTTAAGALCIVLAIAAWRFLPAPRERQKRQEETWLTIPVETFKSLYRGIVKYPEAFKVMIAWTVYNDSIFAFAGVISNLYNLTMRPSLVEFTLYSITGTLSSILCGLGFWVLFPRLKFTLRQWSIGCYIVPAVVCLWCLFGLSASSAVGFKHKAEFFVAQVLVNGATAILSSLFRVLLPELFPRGSEIKYFGFQIMMSLSTVWIPQVVDGPIVNATNNQRLPAIVALVFFIAAAGLAWWTDDKKGIAIIQQEELDEAKRGL